MSLCPITFFCVKIIFYKFSKNDPLGTLIVLCIIWPINVLEKVQGRSQPLNFGWAREEHFLIFPHSFLLFSHFSSTFPHFLLQFGPSVPGGWLAHSGRPWLHHWSECVTRVAAWSSIGSLIIAPYLWIILFFSQIVYLLCMPHLF